MVYLPKPLAASNKPGKVNMASGVNVIYPNGAMYIFGPMVFIAMLGKMTSFAFLSLWAQIARGVRKL